MKKIFLWFLLTVTGLPCLLGQPNKLKEKQRKDISSLIDKYSVAREKKDTILLKTILTSDVDQLVSTGMEKVCVPLCRNAESSAVVQDKTLTTIK